MTDNLQAVRTHNTELKGYVQDYIYVRKTLGDDQTNDILFKAKAEEQALKQQVEAEKQKAEAEKQVLRRPVRSKSYYER